MCLSPTPLTSMHTHTGEEVHRTFPDGQGGIQLTGAAPRPPPRLRHFRLPLYAQQVLTFFLGCCNKRGNMAGDKVKEAPLSSLLAGAGGVAAGCYAMGCPPQKMCHGAAAYAAGAGC